MASCTWIPKTGTETRTSESKIYIYDAGVFTGFLYGTTWHAWEIQERLMRQDGSVRLSVRRMPEDWVPPHVVSVEEYPLLRVGENELEISGWNLQFSEPILAKAETPEVLRQIGQPRINLPQVRRHQSKNHK